MGKAVNFFLALVIIVLSVTNITTYIIYKKSHENYAEIIASQNAQIKQMIESSIVYSAPSIGQQAAASMKNFQTAANNTYQAVSVQSDKITEELKVLSEEAMKVINEQAEKAAAEFYDAAQQMLVKLNEEMQKYKEEMKRNDP